MCSEVVFYGDDDFKICTKDTEEGRFVHCYVRRWNKGIMRRCAEVFCDVKDKAYEDGHDTIYTYTQNTKFALIAGGKYLHSVEFKGKVYEVYSWET